MSATTKLLSQRTQRTPEERAAHTAICRLHWHVQNLLVAARVAGCITKTQEKREGDLAVLAFLRDDVATLEAMRQNLE